MKTMPDYRPSNQVRDKIASKCHVLYYIFRSPVLGSESPTPAKLRILDEETTSNRPTSASDNSNIIESQINSQDRTVNEESEDSEALDPLHIVWPHRWEHDKNPEDFFKVMFQLHDEGVPFKLSVIGQTYQDVPEIFETAKRKLDSVIINWGYQSRSDYIIIIKNADVAVSTANHEFFGVSMLECVSSGCYPLVPNRLVYPEFFTECYRYNTTTQLHKKLRNLCKSISYTRNHQVKVSIFLNFVIIKIS
uniref:Glycosyl transferase family 1 domain-containing protein n=1 Tax=Clytia hemisphaerica TaxID=252671 RepID=A0A7M5UQX2_9CNID